VEFSTQLERSLTPHRAAYNAVMNGWLHERTFGFAYPALLVETFHYVRRSCALMERAEQLLDPQHEAALRAFLRSHSGEERGHEQWLLDDLEVLGYDRAQVADSTPLAETVAMVGSQLHIIDFVHPAGLIGYIYVMESKPPAEVFLRLLHEDFGVPREAMTFLSRHGDADVRHRIELCEILDTCFSEPVARRAALAGAALGLSCVVRLLERLRTGDFLDPISLGTPPLRKEPLHV
jgi:hypothetical protein